VEVPAHEGVAGAGVSVPGAGDTGMAVRVELFGRHASRVRLDIDELGVLLAAVIAPATRRPRG
ncbi:hypothetical protein, partial [Nonomuraea sp. NPDC049784]|uniref:hypothetical protein n=1 Tax=Nonomuraea sp. NPDC049784 TaxID=3154361 RepID=UPI0033DC5726